MGGGDLNMKKHFHPLTMQNLERVWKAEQKAKDEAQKLEQLQKELEEERRREALQQHAIEQGIAKKKNEKLDWMYAGPQVNHEEYLLGKKIDKNVDVLKEDDSNKNESPGASFVPDIADPIKDMAAKIKEDPLFLIRKKEEESKKELVQNPIKLRKLKEMLNISVGDKKKHKKSKKNKKGKHKKHKKERRRKNYENDSEAESDEERERLRQQENTQRHGRDANGSRRETDGDIRRDRDGIYREGRERKSESDDESDEDRKNFRQREHTQRHGREANGGRRAGNGDIRRDTDGIYREGQRRRNHESDSDDESDRDRERLIQQEHTQRHGREANGGRRAGNVDIRRDTDGVYREGQRRRNHESDSDDESDRDRERLRQREHTQRHGREVNGSRREGNGDIRRDRDGTYREGQRRRNHESVSEDESDRDRERHMERERVQRSEKQRRAGDHKERDGDIRGDRNRDMRHKRDLRDRSDSESDRERYRKRKQTFPDHNGGVSEKKSRMMKRQRDRSVSDSSDSDDESDRKGKQEKRGHENDRGGRERQIEGLKQRRQRDKSESETSDREVRNTKARRNGDGDHEEYSQAEIRKKPNLNNRRSSGHDEAVSPDERRRGPGKGRLEKGYIWRQNDDERQVDRRESKDRRVSENRRKVPKKRDDTSDSSCADEKKVRKIHRDDSKAKNGRDLAHGPREYGLIHPKAKSKAVLQDHRRADESKRRLSKRNHDSESDSSSPAVKRTDHRNNNESRSGLRHDSSSDSELNGKHSHKDRKTKDVRRRKYDSESESDSGKKKAVVKKSTAPPPRLISNNISRKLTAEELERRRQEMMDNAKWRDDQRGKNVKKYKMEDEKEAKEIKDRMKGFDRDSKAKFIHDMQVKSYSSAATASVEDRIKRNIYTKQRTRDALNKKFTQK